MQFAVFLSMMKKILFATACVCITVLAAAQHIPKLKMADVVKNFDQKNDSIYVINFWATFCKPCVGEIPGFIQVANKYRSQKVKLLLVSLDLPSFYPKRIATFAAKNNFKTNLAWLEETDADYFCPMIDKAWSGAIPATIIVNTKTGYRKFFEAEMTGAEFEKELKKAIADTKTSFTDPTFSMPMNNVVAVDYFDKNNEKRIFKNGENSAVTFKSKDSSVFSLSEGEVTAVVKVDEMKVVIVKRNKLLYTYSNLRSALVKKGQKIKADQMIGYAALDFNQNIPAMDFYLSNDKDRAYLTRDNFVSRDKNAREHSFDVKEPE